MYFCFMPYLSKVVLIEAITSITIYAQPFSKPMALFKGMVQLAHELESFADSFLDETCGSNRQLDYATPRNTNVCMFSGVEVKPL